MSLSRLTMTLYSQKVFPFVKGRKIIPDESIITEF